MAVAALIGGIDRRVVVLEKHRGRSNLPGAMCFDPAVTRAFQTRVLGGRPYP